MTEIKICGLFRECDIDYVNEARPDYAGFIVNFPKSHRSVDAEKAAELRQRLRPEIRAVGVFVNQPPEKVSSAAKKIGLDIIQLHGDEDDDYIAAIKNITGLPVWKAFKIKAPAGLALAEKSAADEILLDGGCGEGKAFDWSLIKGFARPYILAGGLAPDNISDAIRLLEPKAVDISSGVETDKRKDRSKIIAAVKAVRNEVEK